MFRLLGLLITIALFPFSVQADFFNNFFGQQQQRQQQQQREKFDYQRLQLKSKCNNYLCPETFACVDKPVDCPCPFPDSQTKCLLPDKSNFVCIAKVEKKDLGDFSGEIRDCAWVEKAWNGLV
ncbi:unnamed protein product [Ambrosiozyma monospora]|uniref:Long chronological lifespan protein 2 n=1 Tax=Ambrosiozyma monospora TaxID=43982 RepID=A0A9W6SUN5_AMBMO|nr:unnamed protein product [Ambrosiozyma monospora]